MMALGILLSVFIVIAVVSIMSIALLFLVKDPKRNNVIFAITVILGILISYISVTALPSNFIVSRIVTGSFGALSIIGIVLKLMRKEMLAKILATASVALGVIQLFFF